MFDRKWMNEMYRRAKTDEWSNSLYQDIEAYTPAFEAIRDSLPEKQQKQLDLYISSCEDYARSLSLIAYQLGKELGRQEAMQAIHHTSQ